MFNLSAIKSAVAKVGFAFKKKSPEILVISGILAGAAALVLACKATTKASGIINEAKEELETVKKCAETKPETEYSKEDVEKDKMIVYVQTGVKFIKLFAPAAIAGLLSVTCVLSSVGILKKRGAALAAAYATVDRAFKEYRERVIDRFGEAVDKELRHGVVTKTVEEVITDENGEEKKVEKQVTVYKPSEYSIIFDETNPNWEKTPDYNQMFIRARESYANDMLRAHGHMFLNDVYKMLGAKPTKAGQVVGWLYRPEGSKTGDNYISFNIYDPENEAKVNFDEGRERSIILDFNVDGYILDKFDEEEAIS